MKKQKPGIFKPHELAAHVAALFRMVPHTDMSPVQLSMNSAIKLLLIAEPTVEDLTDPDSGIPYALAINKSDHPERVKAAAYLLRMCLHVIERGESTENERIFIPLQLAALAGYVPDANRSAARKSRPVRSELDVLDRALDEAIRGNPDASWKEIATWLEGENVISEWNEKEIAYSDVDENSEKKLATGTFRNRIKKAKDRRK